MPKESLVVSAVLPAPVAAIHDAWLDPRLHAAMTGSPASVDANGTFHAWDGYITARTITETSAFIVQMWRTSEFPSDVGDSRLEITLEPTSGGTRVTLTQTGLPSGQAANYAVGWQDFYFGPMTEYFERQTAKPTKKPAAKKPAAKKPAAKKAAAKKPAAKKPAAKKPAAKKPAAKKPAAKKSATKKPAAKKPATKKPAAKKPAAKKPAAKKPATKKPA